MTELFPDIRIVKIVIIVGVILLSIAIYLIFQSNYNNPTSINQTTDLVPVDTELTVKTKSVQTIDRKTMEIRLDNIIYLETEYPDLLTDEEANILISQIIGQGYGYSDPEVDQKADKIIDKIEQFMINEEHELRKEYCKDVFCTIGE